MTERRHAFLSYVHEDKAAVDELEAALRAADLEVWRDSKDLWPGQDWRANIRAAIQDGALAMVACISSVSTSKEKTYQNEELALAVDEYRQRQPGSQWLFVVRLDDCPLPVFDLGGGRTLASLNYVDLFGEDKQVNLIRLLTVLGPLIRPALTSSDIAAAVLKGEVATRQENLADALRILLRDPSSDIALEDRMDAAAETARAELEELMPVSRTIPNGEAVDLARTTMRASEAALMQLTEAFVLASTHGLPQHAVAWRRAAETIAEVYDPGSSSYWSGLRAYPLVWLIQATAVAAVSRNNFDALRAVAVDTTLPADAGKQQQEPAGGIANVGMLFEREAWLATAVVRSYDEPDAMSDDRLTALQNGREGALYTPISDLLHIRLRPFFVREIRSQERYDQFFDEGSIVLDALAVDERQAKAPGTFRHSYPGFGRYTYRYRWEEQPPEARITTDTARVEALLRAGLFGGSEERLHTAFGALAEQTAQVRRSRH